MPIYEFECPKCERKTEVFPRRIPKRIYDITPYCPHCGVETKHVMSLPSEPNYGFVPFSTDHISGEMEYIYSRQRKEELMKKHGVIEAG